MLTILYVLFMYMKLQIAELKSQLAEGGARSQRALDLSEATRWASAVCIVCERCVHVYVCMYAHVYIYIYVYVIVLHSCVGITLTSMHYMYIHVTFVQAAGARLTL